MTDDSRREAAIEALLSVLDDPSWGKRHLPEIVGYLDHEDRDVRAGAGWAITMVADEYPDVAPYLARRLADRLFEEDAPTAVEFALDAVAVRYPEVIEEELTAVVAEQESGGAGPASAPAPTRAEYDTPSLGDRPVGRIRLPRGGDADDPRRVYTAEEETQDQPGPLPAEEDEDYAGPPGRELWARTDYLEQIGAASRFDDLTVTAGRRRGRYGDVYRTRATVAGEDLPVALVLFHRPDRVEAFGADLDDALGQWDVVDDHAHVLTIHDWGLSPRPWALTEYAADSMRNGEGVALADALWSGQALANALATAHEQGVVHGGVDPGNVVYYGNLLDDRERRSPLLTDVGVLTVVRRHFDPTGRVDPRYAAPEYYDRSYGRVDHATDIYQLGAVLYRLVTGEHPYTGEYDEVRNAVLAGDPPRPSEHGDAPPGLDDVVTKAMATEKLKRYESVTHLATDLRGIGADA
jgi:hypothetical protein